MKCMASKILEVAKANAWSPEYLCQLLIDLNQLSLQVEYVMTINDTYTALFSDETTLRYTGKRYVVKKSTTPKGWV